MFGRDPWIGAAGVLSGFDAGKRQERLLFHHSTNTLLLNATDAVAASEIAIAHQRRRVEQKKISFTAKRSPCPTRTARINRVKIADQVATGARARSVGSRAQNPP